MEYYGTNGCLNTNPEDLYVYSKRQHHGNTTPAGVGQWPDVRMQQLSFGIKNLKRTKLRMAKGKSGMHVCMNKLN